MVNRLFRQDWEQLLLRPVPLLRCPCCKRPVEVVELDPEDPASQSWSIECTRGCEYTAIGQVQISLN